MNFYTAQVHYRASIYVLQIFTYQKMHTRSEKINFPAQTIRAHRKVDRFQCVSVLVCLYDLLQFRYLRSTIMVGFCNEREQNGRTKRVFLFRSRLNA